MIVTAMACATASMLAGLALAPSAMAAGATITLNGADGNSLAGQAPLPGASPGDTKQAALVSGVTVTGVLAIGFSLCRSRRVSGRHMSC